MKSLFSLLAIALLAVHGQKQQRGKGGRGGEEVATVDVEQEDVEYIPLNSSVPFNETDKTQFSRRQWMEIAINQFFDDFEAGITENAPYLFAPGAPYVSNGIIYEGLDMSNARTWHVIPQKMRIEREFSVMNRTETWVRCLSVYPDGHVSIEFTAFTFDRRGMITTMSKIESKECAPPAAAATVNASTSAGSAPVTPAAATAASTTPATRADSRRVSDMSSSTINSTSTTVVTSVSASAGSPPPKRGEVQAVPIVTITPTASPTIKATAAGGKAKAKGKR